jgi:hypothetical protein
MEHDRAPGADAAQRSSPAGAHGAGVQAAEVAGPGAVAGPLAAPLGAFGPVAALALQRSAGNRATASVLRTAMPAPAPAPARGPAPSVQRRAPDVAVVGAIVGHTPEALRSERKLKRLLHREISRMDSRVAGTELLVAAELAANVPGAVLATVLDVAIPLGANRGQLADVINAIDTVQTNAGGATNVVRYPRPGVVNAPLTLAQQGVLTQLVANAVALMTALSTGGHPATMARVFGTRVPAAEALFAEAVVALTGLHAGNLIRVDNRGDQAAMGAGGLTSPASMTLSPHVLAAVTPANTVTLIHESTHATPTGTSDDCYVDLTPGSPFLTAAEPRKIRLAPHYEEAARIALGLRPVLPVFAPGAAPPQAAGALAVNPDLVKARSAAELIVTRAWTVAINSHDTLVAWANLQAGGAWNALSPTQRTTRDTELRTASRNLGLMMHHRPVVGGQVVAIGDLDLAIAQDRATQLSRLMLKAREITVADHREGLMTWWDTVEHLTSTILTMLVRMYGPIRKSDHASVAMIRGLADSYDNGRFTEVCARVFV